MEIGATGATGEQVETGQKAREEDSGEDEETGGKTEGGGITEGDGEPGPRRKDGATALDIAMSPSTRATDEDRNSPEEPQLIGEGLAGVEVAASETGGQGASTIFQVKTREAAAAGRVGLGAVATGTEESVTDPKPASRRRV
jgi:hypothetical protein